MSNVNVEIKSMNNLHNVCVFGQLELNKSNDIIDYTFDLTDNTITFDNVEDETIRSYLNTHAVKEEIEKTIKEQLEQNSIISK